ncbi:MAG: hypothetical protein INR62_11890 [Rhodospirillales bacterium]|nr:hypothetical protein [Acetobacter sp.]
MKSQILGVLCALLLVPAASARRLPDDPGVPTSPEQFQVNEKTEVPNVTLQPGNYSIRIVDHLRDRVVLQVTDKTNHVATTFIAVPAATMANAPVGPIPYSSGPKGKAALKGFAFSGGTAVEFVYPKNTAVSIATANGTRVMAIDPASEGKVPAPKLSRNDMQLISLWMLEPARVGPDAKPTIAASHYQPPTPAAAPAPVESAQSQPAPPPAAPPAPAMSAAASQPAPAPLAPVRRSRPVQLAQNDVPPPPSAVRTHTRPANVKALPHTASMLPLLWLAAFGSLGLGLSLSTRRFACER